MKLLSFVGKAVLLPVVCLSLSGCVSPRFSEMQRGPRFHEAASANVVLRYASWNYIFLVQPAWREDGYLHQIKRDDVPAALDRLGGPRDTAVVTVGWAFSPEQLSQLVSDWKTLLAKCGYRRVVILRANLDYNIDGAIIVDDSLAAVPASYGPATGAAAASL